MSAASRIRGRRWQVELVPADVSGGGVSLGGWVHNARFRPPSKANASLSRRVYFEQHRFAPGPVTSNLIALQQHYEADAEGIGR
jgi:hypothetical protein